MRRRAQLCGVLLPLLLGACARKSPHVAPDPVASASTSAAKPPPTAPPFAAKNPPIVHAKGDDVAWIEVDGRVGHTTDGGARWTWTNVPGPYSFASLSVARGDGSGWLTVESDDEKTTKIYRADGARWIDVTPKLPSTPSGDHYGVVDAFDRDVAFSARVDEAAPQITMLVTHDGGASWKNEVLKTFTPAMGARFFALDRDRVWALVETEHGMSSMPGLLYFTDDGAARGWMTVVPPPPNAGELSFLDDARGFLLASTTTTSPPSLWRTDDGGRSWRKIFDESDDVGAMPVFDGDDAVLVANDLHFTSDGGRSWSMGGAHRPDGALGQHGHDVLHVDAGAIAGSHAASAFGAPQVHALLSGDPVSIVASTYATAWVVVATKVGSYRVAFTHDGARTWGSIAPP